MNNVLRSIVLLCAALTPTTTAASVLITEVMYDLEGADSGYEWMEITNTGLVPVDVGSWRLFENGTNHKLTLFAGSSTVLPPGSSAVIADKPDNFIARFPEVTLVFDSAFSLSNETETLMLKNGAGEVVDQLTYRSSVGAKGDGASLHLEGEILIPALPNPGVYPGELVPVSAVQEENKESSSPPTSPNTLYAAASAAPRAEGALGLLPWLVGLASIIVLGLAGVWLAKAEQGGAPSANPADEFEIVEVERKSL